MKYENCVEKQTIEYTHTTVPASMRSPYWKYFGFPSDSSNKILTRQKIICTLCGTAITYNKNTSNLRTHLISRHPERLHEMHQQLRQQSTISGCDSDDGSTDILNEIEVDKESEEKVQTSKRANTTNPNLSSVLQIKRVNEGCRGANKISMGNMEEHSCYQREETGNVIMAEPDYLHLKELRDDQHSRNNEFRESIVTNGNGFELLGSELANDASTNGVEEVVINCSNNFTVDTIHNDDDFVESETVIFESEIEQKSMFDNSSDSTPCPAVHAKRLSSLHKNNYSNDLLAEMLVTDLLPVNFLQGIGFRTLLNSLGITNVDKCEIDRKILGDYGHMQCIIKKYISTNLLQDTPYSLSIENYVNNFSIYVNFLNFHYENKLESILYADIVCFDENDLRNALQDFDLSRCAAIVTIEEQNSIINNFAAAHGIEVIPCFDALLTRCLSHIFEQDIVLEMFHRILNLRKNLNLPELPVNCPWSKLKYLQHFLNNLTGTNMQYPEITSDLEPFMAYINPLKITFDTINTEPLPLCTLVRPLITKLFEEHFLVFNTDGNVYLQSAQNIINSELRKYVAAKVHI